MNEYVGKWWRVLAGEKKGVVGECVEYDDQEGRLTLKCPKEGKWVVRKGLVSLVEDVPKKEYTGGSVSYYTVELPDGTKVECNQIIEALCMNYAEGNAFKAIWRKCAAQHLGKAKAGYDTGLYDAEKVVYFGNRLVVQEKSKLEEGKNGLQRHSDS
jgi:hypothetical protein